MVITADCVVRSIDLTLWDRTAALRLDPVFELGIAGFVVLDIGHGCVAIDTEAIEDHLVEAGTAFGIVFGELTRSAQAQLGPETGKVDCTEGTGNTRTDIGDNGHGYSPEE